MKEHEAEPELRDSFAYCPRCDMPNLEAQALAFAAKLIRDDIAKSIDLAELESWNNRTRLDPTRESACSAVMKTENILALNTWVKAVFDE
jgi:hypothetical protein